MKILSINQGHDISSVYLNDASLVFSHEAEKDSGPRHSMLLSPSLLLQSLEMDDLPDVFAFSGWHKNGKFHAGFDTDYFGTGADSRKTSAGKIFGKNIHIFSSSHERSHILCSYGLSDFPQHQPCYALVWEGSIGAFYYIDENITISKIGDVLSEPGNKYGFLYALADPSMPIWSTYIRLSDAGKLMALAAFGSEAQPTATESKTIKEIMGLPTVFGFTHKAAMKNSPYFNIGLESQEFKNLARRFSEALFDKFYKYAKLHIKEKLPLLISGGCGLNCDWNSQWKDCGLFSDVFVPPCTNDSGVALGAAIDAQLFYTGNGKIEWDVYCGQNFLDDTQSADLTGFVEKELNMQELTSYLANGEVFAWVQGRAEMGPRALGNRSLLASPFKKEIRDRLNSIKFREGFRPIAPICMEEELDKHFENQGPSPYMLYFHRVKFRELAAVTHVDGSARVQTVSPLQNPEVYSLLKEFKKLTGYGVLCNTSLNFPGYGFINRLSDLAEYVRSRAINGFVVGNKLYLNQEVHKEFTDCSEFTDVYMK